MEKKIEIDTWVRHKHLGTAHKVKSINDGEFDDKISVTNSPSFDGEYMREYIPWLPKEDDYIWDARYKTLGHVTYSDGITVSYIDILDNPVGEFLTTSPSYCEPFFGSLPTFYKNKIKKALSR